MKNKKLELLLYKSFDSHLTEEEAELLRQELQSSKELRRKYNEISEIRKAISNTAETSFDPFFEQRILSKINNTQSERKYVNVFADSLVFSFRKVALVASFLLVALISYNLISGNNYSIEGLLGTSKTPIEYAFDSTLNLFWSGI
jgi:hypothetical protein